jgi:hypothetical protein
VSNVFEGPGKVAKLESPHLRAVVRAWRVASLKRTAGQAAISITRIHVPKLSQLAMSERVDVWTTSLHTCVHVKAAAAQDFE